MMLPCPICDILWPDSSGDSCPLCGREPPRPTRDPGPDDVAADGGEDVVETTATPVLARTYFVDLETTAELNDDLVLRDGELELADGVDKATDVELVIRQRDWRVDEDGGRDD